MVSNILKTIFGSKNERELKRLWPIVEKVGSYDNEYQGLTDQQLRDKTNEFRERYSNGESLDSLLPEAFAVVREGSSRALGLKHYDVQILGGIVLHEGKIAEMRTGEGKTLTATLPLYLNALAGKGSHLVTVNDYLARRDAEQMGRLYSFLGMSTGVVLSQMNQVDKQRAYSADITYGQNNEFGFDYLRDNMKQELSEMAQREHFYAIVDEVDSILIDEARTPLIISGPTDNPTETYALANNVVQMLKDVEHFEIDAKSKQILLTDSGVRRLEEILKIDNLYDPLNIQLVHHVQQALKAHHIMKRDVDYVVREGEVIIVDEFTGRLMSGRRWSDGLHQAVEAKEGVGIEMENQTLATITFQNYFRLYKKLAGMTGTADTEAVELKKIYNLDVIVVPPNKKMIRIDNPDIVFSNEAAKYSAVCEDIKEKYDRGQPVLVGTASIEKSELISSMLSKMNIKHNLLNAKHHEREADIIAQAGRLGAVTISTNMAGRGTDILLGGNPDYLAKSEIGIVDPTDQDYLEARNDFKKQCDIEHDKVVELGGLHVIGTERHESRRIDNQLRGRSGRQGDPGSSRFYISLEDDLLKRFGGERIKYLMSIVGFSGDDAIEGYAIGNTIRDAQRKVESFNFDLRKHLLEFDDVLNKQREVVFSLRNKIMRNESVENIFLEAIPDIIEEIIVLRSNEKESPSKWDFEGIFAELERIFGEKSQLSDYVDAAGLENIDKSVAQKIFDNYNLKIKDKYSQKLALVGNEVMVQFIRKLYLDITDHFWKEHLMNIDHLKEGISLRAFAQKNPLQEYQKEAFHLFSSLISSIKYAVVQTIMRADLLTQDQLKELEERERLEQAESERKMKAFHESLSNDNEEPEVPVQGNRTQRRAAKKNSR